MNASGTQEDHTDYTAFGVIITQTSASAQGRFAFTCKDTDSRTGFQYNFWRYYSPDLGTFISVDPILFEGGLTKLDGYCGNGPTNATDPIGLADEQALRPATGASQRSRWCELSSYCRTRRKGIEVHICKGRGWELCRTSNTLPEAQFTTERM